MVVILAIQMETVEVIQTISLPDQEEKEEPQAVGVLAVVEVAQGRGVLVVMPKGRIMMEFKEGEEVAVIMVVVVVIEMVVVVVVGLRL